MNRLGYVVVALIVLFAGKAWGEAGPPTIVTRTDTVALAEMERMVAELQRDTASLRGRIEGLETRAPERVLVTDTLTELRDSIVYRFVNIDARGRLSIDLLTARDSLFARELRTEIDVSDCDEGYGIQEGTVICDPARFGHLYVGPWVSLHPAGAVWWKPSYRSLWEAYVSYSGTWDFGLRRGVQLW